MPQGEALPESVGGVPVDVREANLYQRLLAIDPLAAEVSQIYRRPEDASPIGRWNLNCQVGELPEDHAQRTQKKLAVKTKEGAPAEIESLHEIQCAR